MSLFSFCALVGVVFASLRLALGDARSARLRARLVGSRLGRAMAAEWPRHHAALTRPSVPLLIAMLVATLVAEVEILRTIVAHLTGYEALERRLPVTFLPWTGYLRAFYEPTPLRMRLALTSVMVVRALALWGLWLRVRDRAPGRFDGAAIVVGAVATAGAALAARGIDSADLYGYLAYARLGFAAYAPPARLFAGTPFAVLKDVADVAWYGGLNPSPYGPLWLALSGLVAGRAPSLQSAVLLERGLGLLAVAALTWAVARLTRRRETALLVALNPSLVYYYVVEAHSDAVPLALVAVAFALIARPTARASYATPLAFAAVVCAGLMKAPYALVGPLAFASEPRPLRRIALALGAVATTAAVSALVGGRAYLAALTYHAGLNADRRFPEALPHEALALAALVAVGLAVLRRRTEAGFAFAPPALTAAAYPWYLALGLPYALAARDALPAYLILFPIAALLMQPILADPTLDAVVAVAACLCALPAWLHEPPPRAEPA